MSAPYMPLYIADFQADTVHLKGGEAGAYLLLLMAMWRSGGNLDNDDKKLARYAKLTPQEWRRIRDQVMDFFVADEADGTKITQMRLRRELAKYQAQVEKRTERASKGGKAKSLKNNKMSVLEAELSSASEVLDPANQNQNQNHIRENISNDTFSLTGEGAWEEFVSRYPGQGAKASRAAWLEAVGSGAEPSDILDGLARSAKVWEADGREGRWIPMAKNYLRDKGWLAHEVTEAAEVVSQMPTTWAGPAEIRAAVVMERGEGFTRSYLDPARWDGRQFVIPATGTAAQKLRSLDCLQGRISEKVGVA